MKNKILKLVRHPSFILLYLSKIFQIDINDELYLKLLYKYKFDKNLNLENPKTFNEKLQWLKLYDRKDIYTTMVDKYEAKNYVANIIGEEYIIPTIGIYNKFEDIDFNKLPNQFVIKCTHDSGGLVICKDKAKLDIKATRKKINKCLKRNYYYSGREWPYKNVKPRILIEKYMCTEGKKSINDYKFQTFNGKVGYCLICTDRDTNVKFTFFDKNKKFINVTQCGQPNDPQNAKLPKNYDKMVEIAELLSNNIPEVRVDFYEIENKIYFGELNFFATSGFGWFEPEEWDLKFGNLLNLSVVKKNEK